MKAQVGPLIRLFSSKSFSRLACKARPVVHLVAWMTGAHHVIAEWRGIDDDAQRDAPGKRGGSTTRKRDLLIVTIAIHHDAELVTFDRDFQEIVRVCKLRYSTGANRGNRELHTKPVLPDLLCYLRSLLFRQS